MDEHLLIDGELEHIVNEVHERLEKASMMPFVTSGPVPEGLRRTIFGMAWKSGVDEIHLGFTRSDDNRMMIVGATLTYQHIQGPKWNYKVSFERRGMYHQKVNQQGDPETVYVPGRGSEKIFDVKQHPFSGSFHATAPPRKSMGGPIPEAWEQAKREIDDYRVSFTRLDRQIIRMEFNAHEDRIEVGIAKTLCHAREIPKLVEPNAVTAPAAPADLDGAINDALRQMAPSGRPGPSSPDAPYQGQF
jgi:hypothetical protein